MHGSGLHYSGSRNGYAPAAVSSRYRITPPPPPKQCSRGNQHNYSSGQQFSQHAAVPRQPLWRQPVEALLSLARVALKPALPLEPPTSLPSITLALDLQLGSALQHIANAKQRQEAGKAAYLQITHLQQLLQGGAAEYVQAVQCSHNLADRSASIRLIVQQTPAAVAWAKSAARQPFNLGNLQVPTSLRVLQQPVGSVQVLIQNPPAGYAKQGFTQSLLAAAGYTSEVAVVAEFIGGDNIVGGAAGAIPCLNTVVAWVRPPATDRLLKHLPDSFATTQGNSRVFVQGRPAGAQHLWSSTDSALDLALHYLQQVLPPDATAADIQGASDPQQQQQQQQHRQQQQQHQHQQLQQQQPLPQQQHPQTECRSSFTTTTSAVDRAADDAFMEVDAMEALAAGSHMDIDVQTAAAIDAANGQGQQQQRSTSQQVRQQQQQQQQPQPQQQADAAFLHWEHSPAADAVGYHAQRLAEEMLESSLTGEQLLGLKRAYFQQHQPIQGTVPADTQLIRWLQHQLQISGGSYGEILDEELHGAAAALPAVAAAQAATLQSQQMQHSQQQQQQPQVQQQKVAMVSQAAAAAATAGPAAAVDEAATPGDSTTGGPRRTPRATAGSVSKGYSQLFGKGFLVAPFSTPKPQTKISAPPTPATPANPGRRKGRPGH